MNRHIKAFLTALVLVLTGIPFLCHADSETDFSTLKEKHRQSFNRTRQDMDHDRDRMEKDRRNQWRLLKAAVEKKWQKFFSSTRTEWVEYDPDLNTRSRVDFKNGRIEIETLLPAAADGKEQAEKIIAHRVRAVLEKTVAAGRTVLDRQVTDGSGRIISSKNIDAFIRKEILPRMTKPALPYTSRDGKQRARYSVKIDMVPDHMEIRAKRVLALVSENARRFKLDPGLLMAVIHTESYFNPLAFSDAGAIGLMQVIPRYGGRDAYRFLYDADWSIQPEYLYSPGINIELGAAYLHLLENRYFKQVKDPEKRRYLVVCAYNWGPTAVRKNILNRFSVSKMPPDKLYALLRQKTPRETRNYLGHVTERTTRYASYFN